MKKIVLFFALFAGSASLHSMDDEDANIITVDGFTIIDSKAPSKEKRFSCPYSSEGCFFAADIKCRIKDHVKQKHLDIRRLCDICKKESYLRSNDLKFHKQNEHGVVYLKKMTGYYCYKCPFSTNKKKQYELHINSKNSHC